MKVLFYRQTPRMSDYLWLGLFLAVYLAAVGLLFLPRLSPGFSAEASVTSSPAGSVEARLQQ